MPRRRNPRYLVSPAKFNRSNSSVRCCTCRRCHVEMEMAPVSWVRRSQQHPEDVAAFDEPAGQGGEKARSRRPRLGLPVGETDPKRLPQAGRQVRVGRSRAWRRSRGAQTRECEADHVDSVADAVLGQKGRVAADAPAGEGAGVTHRCRRAPEVLTGHVGHYLLEQTQAHGERRMNPDRPVVAHPGTAIHDQRHRRAARRPGRRDGANQFVERIAARGLGVGWPGQCEQDEEQTGSLPTPDPFTPLDERSSRTFVPVQSRAEYPAGRHGFATHPSVPRYFCGFRNFWFVTRSSIVGDHPEVLFLQTDLHTK
jgi:hypothetical protein